MTLEVPAGSEVSVQLPTLRPYPPLLDALRAALPATESAVVIGLSANGGPPQDVIGLLPVTTPTGGATTTPEALAAAIEDHLPRGHAVATARLALQLAVGALRVAPPIGGTRLERLAVEAARSAEGASRLMARPGDETVLVPVEDAALTDLDPEPAFGGAVQVADLPIGVPVPRLPLMLREQRPALHVFSGVWPLLHADAPFPGVLRCPLSRLAPALPDDAAVAIDVGCLHATLVAPSTP